MSKGCWSSIEGHSRLGPNASRVRSTDFAFSLDRLGKERPLFLRLKEPRNICVIFPMRISICSIPAISREDSAAFIAHQIAKLLGYAHELHLRCGCDSQKEFVMATLTGGLI